MKTEKISTTIILAATQHMPVSGYDSHMLPIRGKPCIAWVIDEFYQKDNVVLVLDKNNTKVMDYIEHRYPEIKIVGVTEEDEINKYHMFSILNSLNAGLSKVKENETSLKIVLGDTLCRTGGYNNFASDMILVSEDFDSSDRWCLVETNENNQAKEFYDKKPNLPTKGKFAVVGYYQLNDVKLLKNIVDKCIEAKKKQISDVLSEYMKIHAITCNKVENWFDLGHRAGIIKAQNNFFNSRDFNSLYTNQITGTITKISSKIQKLRDEYDWYKNLPDELKVLSPRPIGFEENLNDAALTMEMYGYPALSELFILGNLSIEEWKLIIKRLFEVHQVFEKHKGNLDKENFYDLYLHKTWQRLKDLREQNPYWEKMWQYDDIIVNGQKYKNIRFFETKLVQKIDELVQSVDVSVMHGDYCFSNILFDTNSFLCRLIDPRGRLHDQTIYGDSRYDIAKLRHSVVGGYDYAVHGLFELVEKGNEFTVANNYPDFQEKLTDYFDEMTEQFGYDSAQIKLIEALLFTSMIPLHKDSMERQKLFYLKAVKKLNELFEE